MTCGTRTTFPFARELGWYLDQHRRRRRKWKYDLAQEIGVSGRRLYPYLAGHRTPRLPLFIRLATALELSLGDLEGVPTGPLEAPRKVQEAVVAGSLWDILRSARERKGLLPSELAAKAGISAGRIAGFEAGVDCPRVLALFRLAGELGLDLGTFAPFRDRLDRAGGLSPLDQP